MTTAGFVLDLYLAAVLGISGLTKVKEPAEFATTLYRHRILPSWSIPGISRVLPWIEVALASALVIGLATLLTAALVLILVGAFFIIETILLVNGSATKCGCYGTGHAGKVDGASVLTSAALVGIAALHLWAVHDGGRVAWAWRLAAIALCGGAGFWLLWRAMHRRRVVTPLASA